MGDLNSDGDGQVNRTAAGGGRQITFTAMGQDDNQGEDKDEGMAMEAILTNANKRSFTLHHQMHGEDLEDDIARGLESLEHENDGEVDNNDEVGASLQPPKAKKVKLAVEKPRAGKQSNVPSSRPNKENEGERLHLTVVLLSQSLWHAVKGLAVRCASVTYPWIGGAVKRLSMDNHLPPPTLALASCPTYEKFCEYQRSHP